MKTFYISYYSNKMVRWLQDEAKRTTKQSSEWIKERKFHILFILTLTKIITGVLQVIGKWGTNGWLNRTTTNNTSWICGMHYCFRNVIERWLWCFTNSNFLWWFYVNLFIGANLWLNITGAMDLIATNEEPRRGFVVSKVIRF